MEIKIRWTLTVNSPYRKLTKYREENNCFQWIWTSQAPLKVKVHMWLAFHDHFLTTDNLAKSGLLISSPCLLCGANSKTTGHIFLHCPFTLELWEPEKNRLALSYCPPLLILRSSISHIETNHWDCVVNVIIWVIWHERNQQIFKAKSFSILELGC